MKVHLLLISGNETEKDKGDRHAPQNLTADHLTGEIFTGGHQNVNQLTAGYMIGVPNLGGRQNVNQLTAGYMTGVPNLGGRQNGDHVAAQYLAGGRSPGPYLNVGNSARGHAPE